MSQLNFLIHYPQEFFFLLIKFQDEKIRTSERLERYVLTYRQRKMNCRFSSFTFSICDHLFSKESQKFFIVNMNVLRKCSMFPTKHQTVNKDAQTKHSKNEMETLICLQKRRFNSFIDSCIVLIFDLWSWSSGTFCYVPCHFFFLDSTMVSKGIRWFMTLIHSPLPQ